MSIDLSIYLSIYLSILYMRGAVFADAELQPPPPALLHAMIESLPRPSEFCMPSLFRFSVSRPLPEIAHLLLCGAVWQHRQTLARINELA